jgi:hypothetical protein
LWKKIEFENGRTVSKKANRLLYHSSEFIEMSNKSVKTPPPTHKGGKKSNPNTPLSPAIVSVEDFLVLPCSFRSKVDAMDSADRCFLSSNLLKKLGSPSLGALAILEFDENAHVLCQLWPLQKDFQKLMVSNDTASLCGIWSENFENKLKHRISNDNSYVKINRKNANT